jgi:hypothetical protein
MLAIEALNFEEKLVDLAVSCECMRTKNPRNGLVLT